MVIALCYVNFANADTDFATGAGATASVDLDFQIVIPRFIYFRVGTVGSINTINFSPTATEVATGATINGTGGDAGPGAVNVEVISNGGNITITELNDGGGVGLIDGANNISYAQIITADTSGNISAPTLSDAGGNTSSIAPAGVTNLSDVWTYTYTNPATPPAAGTYGGSIANGGRVTYTAAVP